LGEDLHLIYTKEKNPQSVNEYVWKRIDSDLLSTIISSDKIHQSDYYICWSAWVITSCIKHLTSLWINKNRIHHEAFTM
jgi:ferredoxin-NADP reductase